MATQAAGTRDASDVEQFCALVAGERDLVGRILVVAHELAGFTIERLLAKSDLEVGLETMFGVPPDRRAGTG